MWRRDVIISLTLAAGLCGCASSRPQFTLRFHEEVDSHLPSAYARVVDVPQVNLRIPVAVAPTLTEKDVQEASLVQTAGGAAVMLKFDIHGAIKLDEMTTRDRGQRVVVFVNNVPVAAVLIQQRLTTGQFLLEGTFTDKQAQELVDSLNKDAKQQQHTSLTEEW